MRQTEDYRRFVLMSTQRTGSTWVTDMLNSHPAIAAYTELFLQAGVGMPDWCIYKDTVYWSTYYRQMKSSGQGALRPRLLFRYLDELYRKHPDKQATGFKLMYGQAFRLPETLAYVRSRRVSVVHLTRHNTLDIVLSDMAKSSRGMAHARTETSVPTVQLNVDIPAMLHEMRRLERHRRMAGLLLRHLGVPCHELVYEDLVADPAVMNRCIEFLGLEQVPLASSLKKMNTQSHRDLLANYADVRLALAATPFASMLR